MAAKSAEARKVLRELHKELEAASVERGEALHFSAAETAILGQISSILDRKAELLELYEAAEDMSSKVKLSAEVRLLEQAAARLVKDIKTDIPAASSVVSSKARHAARTRWERSRASGQ